MSNCSTCGQPLKLIAAGISKTTGRNYNAFWSCPNKCKQPYVAPQAQYNAPTQQRVETPNWDKISLGKVRHGVAIEAIKLGKELNPETATWIEKWSNYIMTGELNLMANVEVGTKENINLQYPPF